jgi:hypothetical protein
MIDYSMALCYACKILYQVVSFGEAPSPLWVGRPGLPERPYVSAPVGGCAADWGGKEGLEDLRPSKPPAEQVYVVS